MSRSLSPLWVSELELADPPPRLVAGPLPAHAVATAGVDTGRYQKARILIRLQGEPLGVMSVSLTRGEAPIEAVVAEAAEQFAPAIERRLGSDWRRLLSERMPLLSPELAAVLDDPDLPGVSVVIGTRNRPDHAANCVARVRSRPIPARSK